MASGTWISTSGGVWWGLLNWDSLTVADGANAVATFSTNIPSPQTVTLDAPVRLGRLSMSDAGAAGSAWTVDGPSALTFDDIGTPQVTATTTIFLNAPLSGTNGFTKLGAAPLVLGASTTSALTGVIVTGSNIQVLSTFTNGITVQSTAAAVLGPTTLSNGTLDVRSGAITFSPTGTLARIGRITGGVGNTVSFNTGPTGNTLRIGSDTMADSFFDATTSFSSVGFYAQKDGSNKITIGSNGRLPFNSILKGEVEIQGPLALSPLSFVTVSSLGKLTINFTGTASFTSVLAAGPLVDSGPTISVASGVNLTTTQFNVAPIRGSNAPATVSVLSGSTLATSSSSGFAYSGASTNQLLDVILRGGGTINSRSTGSGAFYFTVREGTVFTETASASNAYWNIENGTVNTAGLSYVYANIASSSVLSVAYSASGNGQFYGIEGTGSLRGSTSTTCGLSLATNTPINGLPTPAASTRLNFSGRIGGDGTNENNISFSLTSNTGNFVSYLDGSNNTYTGDTTVQGTTLDGIGTIVNSTVRLAQNTPNTILGAGKGVGAGDFTVNNVNWLTSSPRIFFRASKSGASAPSKLVIRTLTQAPGSAVNVIGAGSGWLPGTTYTVVSFSPPRATAPVVNAAAGAWTDSLNSRVGNGTVTSDVNGIYLTPSTTPISLTWNGGVGGDWYSGASGFIAAGPTPSTFYNGDSVLFSNVSSVPAVLTSDVTLNTLIFRPNASHSITSTTGKRILSGGPLVVEAGSSPQVLGVEAYWSSIEVSGPLTISHASALKGGGTFSFFGGGSLLFTAASDVIVPFALAWNPTPSSIFYIQPTGGRVIRFTGSSVGAGNGSATTTIIGDGIFEIQGPQTAYAQQIVIDNPYVSAGRNVFSTTSVGSDNSGLSNGTLLSLLRGGIFETAASTFNRVLSTASTSATDFIIGTGGGGFSARGTELSVTTVNLFGTGLNQWNGPIYFGTAFGSATQKTSLTAATITISAGVDQTFHVFSGAASTPGNFAAIKGTLVSTGDVIVRKAGPATLELWAANTYTGETVLDQGELHCKNRNSLGVSDTTVKNGTSLRALASSDSSGTVLTAKSMTLNSGSTVVIGE